MRDRIARALRPWGTAMPVYVTRENADGIIGTFFWAAWIVVASQFLIASNLIGWGVYGLYALGDKII